VGLVVAVGGPLVVLLFAVVVVVVVLADGVSVTIV
jgi:hypothetical protein